MEGREEEVWSVQLQLRTEDPQLVLTVQRIPSRAAFPHYFSHDQAPGAWKEAAFPLTLYLVRRMYADHCQDCLQLQDSKKVQFLLLPVLTRFC